ncbi:MAG: rRNA methyltransferase [Spirochaetaceae bacterium]|jgi:ribosomal protein RSM22 (predicted rRNA methylase)|nr:rRNA methyltransferase [Spirochaetaceae bacterium]
MTQDLFTPLSFECEKELERLYGTIKNNHKIEKKFYAWLPKNINDLSLLLTKDRAMRNSFYLSEPALCSAYLYYFLPWNVYRLCRCNLQNLLCLKENDNIIDMGCGPLTFIFALWIAIPEYRNLNLNFYCIDKNIKIMQTGKKIFKDFSGADSKWRITLVPASFYSGLKVPPAALVGAVNVCNEIFWNINQADISALDVAAEKQAKKLAGLASANGQIFVAEPGVPRCGQFLNLMRNCFLQDGLSIKAPCTHSAPCAAGGGKRGTKWCHFAFDTKGAPKELVTLSAAAALSKERAAISFLLAEKKPASPLTSPPLLKTGRVISDSFPLPSSMRGRYACITEGLALVSGYPDAIEKYPCGSVLNIQNTVLKERDPKSGAYIIKQKSLLDNG